MAFTLKPVVLAACAAALASGSALAQPAKPDPGKQEYETHCASCHGVKGMGDGPLSRGYLKRNPSNLTTLAKNNGGVMPVARLYGAIEGSGDIGAHGSRDMPVWGNRYRAQAAEHYVDVPYDPGAYVRTRIFSLIDYLHRLQQK